MIKDLEKEVNPTNKLPEEDESQDKQMEKRSKKKIKG